jgi:NAD(P)-dependent dehydrogenase (short-subunit alcohol dehydrogenase family)
MHAVLWALDRLAESGMLQGGVAGIRVQFAKFIPTAKTVRLRVAQANEKAIRAELDLEGLTTTTLGLSLGAPAQAGRRPTPRDKLPTVAASEQPVSLLRVEDSEKLAGWIDMANLASSLGPHFPHAASSIGARRLAGLALLSRLVGMVCPGLHSIFAAFAMDLLEGDQERDGIEFSVIGTDDRFRMIRMQVDGPGLRGSVQTFLRWPPVVQASLDDIMKLVGPAEFAGSTALVVGGSRGLGALTAKVIAAGGGKVVVSYATGRKDAEDVAEEIRARVSSDACRVIQYDVRLGAAGQLKDIVADVSHLYYFATAAIARQKAEPFAAELFNEFTRVYVDGFYECCRFFEKHGRARVVAFYPSSVFVEDSPESMLEYTMAKAAGETLCAHMNRSGPRVHAVVSRLPRLLTDQTATVPLVSSGDPLEVMLPVIRRVQSFMSEA